VKPSHMTGTGLLVAASATALVVGLNAGSSAAPRVANHRPVSSTRLMTSVGAARSVASSSPRIHTFIAGKRGLVVYKSEAIWTVPVKPGLYEVSFKAILSVTQQGTPPQPTQAICGALDLKTLNHNIPWIYTVDSADYTGQIPAAMSGSATVPVRPGAIPGVLCATTGQPFQLLSQFVVTFKKVSSRQVSHAKRLFVAPKTHAGIARLFKS
jgi:hypothetical protein